MSKDIARRYRKSIIVCQTKRASRKYLVSNFDEQGENDDDKQVVKDADTRCQGRRQFR